MTDLWNEEGYLPEPPIEAHVSLNTFEQIEMPIDWLSEEWALGLSHAALGIMFRLYSASIRQSPAGSLPGCPDQICRLVAGLERGDDIAEALALWPVHSDGRRYWARCVPLIEAAWGRRKGKTSKDALRKRRQRLGEQLIKCGLSQDGAANRDVQDMVLAELGEGRLELRLVHDAASRAGIIGPVRKLSADTNGQSVDSHKLSRVTLSGQSRDSHGTVRGQSSDSPFVSDAANSTRY
ncbi:hypothetical protein [Thioclava kandeliae]|uniref:DUF1376 domain-containing protein n=1 Tax=Thioclava kandeliae TaxID=3070818 RepID=A0ABV1SIC4_9RHOB